MKHYIIVKFKDKSDTKNLLEEIRDLFSEALMIQGVRDVKIHPSNSTRDNRYSLMIEMTLTPEGLEAYDRSEMHKRWKAEYGERIESKAIFDCEE